MNTIGGTNEDVSIAGTGISHVPLNGKPEFDGLMVDEKGNAVARIRDGALVHEIGDIDVAIGWRSAWTAAVSHMVLHRQKQQQGGRS